MKTRESRPTNFYILTRNSERNESKNNLLIQKEKEYLQEKKKNATYNQKITCHERETTNDQKIEP